MRRYQPKDNVQKQSYYTDCFYVAPRVPRQEVESDAAFHVHLKALSEKFEIEEAYLELGQMVVIIRACDNVPFLEYAKEQLGYEMLSEVSAMDYLADRGGFEVFYQMLSLKERRRMRVKCFLEEGRSIETVENLFKNANFAEREMYDMFGIIANNHSYMKRILMPDDWQGYPLLKTYPLQGDEFAQWYEVDKIFGKEYRDVIGPEERDPAKIDRYDTERFARLGQEVPFGADLKEGEGTPLQYQEEKAPLLIKKMKPEDSKQLEKRK